MKTFTCSTLRNACLFVLSAVSSTTAMAVCVPSGAPGFVCPDVVSGKEYSTRFDFNAAGVPAPLQTLHWLGGEPGPSGVADGLDYKTFFPRGLPGNEVDAMANRADHLFTFAPKVSDDEYHLLFNVGNEPDIRWETPKIATSGLWGAPPLPGVVGGHRPTGVDALEVWGGDTALGLDADRFSFLGDPGGIAVWTDAGAPLVTSGMIAGAIGLPTHLIDRLDLDALMVGGGGFLLFSIAPVGPFDGGEIWFWDTTAGPVASFLKHGGHLWDTAFPVAATYGLLSEDVTVLEAVDVSAVPEAETWAMLLAGLGLVAGAVRRRRA